MTVLIALAATGIGKRTMTVGGLFTRWIENYRKTNVKPWKTAQVKAAKRSLRSVAYSLSILKGALSRARRRGSPKSPSGRRRFWLIRRF